MSCEHSSNNKMTIKKTSKELKIEIIKGKMFHCEKESIFMKDINFNSEATKKRINY